jgi:ABC-type Mn2+/Zn2+ transport system ATPase subunit
MSLLQLSSATLGYAKQSVLRAVSFEIHPGDFVLLAGANGSGKSTLLRSLIGALPLLAGKMSRASDLCIGYVPQQMSLPEFFPVTVLDVVTMGTWRHTLGISRGGRAAARAVLTQVGLGDQRNQSFAQLSGGQKQRVLLARALVSRPSLLILDEPISGVDEAAAAVILRVLSESAAQGVAVAMVTHQPHSMADVATRSLLVNQGTVEEIPVQEMCSLAGVSRLWV